MVTLKFALKLFASAVFACGVQVSECYQSPCFAQDSPAVNAESSAAGYCENVQLKIHFVVIRKLLFGISSP